MNALHNVWYHLHYSQSSFKYCDRTYLTMMVCQCDKQDPRRNLQVSEYSSKKSPHAKLSVSRVESYKCQIWNFGSNHPEFGGLSFFFKKYKYLYFQRGSAQFGMICISWWSRKFVKFREVCNFFKLCSKYEIQILLQHCWHI